MIINGDNVIYCILSIIIISINETSLNGITGYCIIVSIYIYLADVFDDATKTGKGESSPKTLC